jgi:hypothetical protein
MVPKCDILERSDPGNLDGVRFKVINYNILPKIRKYARIYSHLGVVLGGRIVTSICKMCWPKEKKYYTQFCTLFTLSWRCFVSKNQETTCTEICEKRQG